MTTDFWIWPLEFYNFYWRDSTTTVSGNTTSVNPLWIDVALSDMGSSESFMELQKKLEKLHIKQLKKENIKSFYNKLSKKYVEDK